MSNSIEKKLPTKISYTGILEILDFPNRDSTSEYETARAIQVILQRGREKVIVEMPQVTFLETKEE